jgi:fumarate hydratase class I
MKTLTAPFNREKIRELHVGDIVHISGTVVTARDAAHKYLHDGHPCPLDLTNKILYHCGPVVLKDEKTGEWLITAAGPTTSIREEPYEHELIAKQGLVGVIGKGGMGAKTLAACKEHGCVYFHAIGGAAQVLASKIVKVKSVHLMELGIPEAMWELEVKDFPVVVTMDAHGKSLHEDILKTATENLKKLM